MIKWFLMIKIDLLLRTLSMLGNACVKIKIKRQLIKHGVKT